MIFDELTIHTDGGARGNPGPAAIGVTIYHQDTLVHEFGKVIGETTNNVAEYTAVIEALQWIHTQQITNQGTQIRFFCDSLLIVNQLKGVFKIKDGKLKDLAIAVHMLEKRVGGMTTYTAIRRELNKQADALVNKALDTDIH